MKKHCVMKDQRWYCFVKNGSDSSHFVKDSDFMKNE